jgi:hypothetical protein
MALDCLAKFNVKKFCAFVVPAGLLFGLQYFVMLPCLETAQSSPRVSILFLKCEF